jgi:hypothetical protein
MEKTPMTVLPPVGLGIVQTLNIQSATYNSPLDVANPLISSIKNNPMQCLPDNNDYHSKHVSFADPIIEPEEIVTLPFESLPSPAPGVPSLKDDGAGTALLVEGGNLGRTQKQQSKADSEWVNPKKPAQKNKKGLFNAPRGPRRKGYTWDHVVGMWHRNDAILHTQNEPA